MFEFLKKDSGQVPPDVGDEDAFDKENAESENAKEEEVKMPDKIETEKEVKPTESFSAKDSVMGSVSKLEIEKVKGRVDSVVEWINQFYERFAYVSENIGELRAMNIANEKKILSATKDAEMVIDIVKEVKPADLRLAYQKIDMRIRTFEEKVAENKQFMDEIMKEVEDIKRKSEVFIGTDSLIKLNEDTKKDLVEVQRINSRTKMYADKSQEIFMELKKGFADSQKLAAIVDNLEGSYSGLRDEIQRVKLNHETVVNQSNFDDFKKTFGNKIAILDGAVKDLDNLKNGNSVLEKAIENSFSVSRRNKEDIGKIAMKVGESDVKSVEEYNNQIIELLDIVNTLTVQVAELRKKAGIKSAVLPEKKVVVSKHLPESVNVSVKTTPVPVVKKNILKKPVVEPKKTDDENPLLDSTTELKKVEQKNIVPEDTEKIESKKIDKPKKVTKKSIGLKVRKSKKTEKKKNSRKSKKNI